MTPAFKPIVLILAAATLVCATEARGQYQQPQYSQPSGPSDAQNWQERGEGRRRRHGPGGGRRRLPAR